MKKFFKANKLRHAVWALCLGIIITCAFSAYADKTEDSISENIIRLHVIANSDSEDDQHLKIAVRDAIIEKVGAVFEDNKGKQDAESKICAHINEIKDIADEVVLQWGYDYDVKVEFGKSDFPTKTYGNITLPAGSYDALKVIIGDGEGKNWWCVLFPPLCFVDAATAYAPLESQMMLKDTMDNETYQMITGGGELPVKVKFKAYELWQSSKIKIKNAVAVK